jgi:hypothetical protein
MTGWDAWLTHRLTHPATHAPRKKPTKSPMDAALPRVCALLQIMAISPAACKEL